MCVLFAISVDDRHEIGFSRVFRLRHRDDINGKAMVSEGMNRQAGEPFYLVDISAVLLRAELIDGKGR